MRRRVLNFLALLASALLFTATPGAAQDGAERKALLDRRQALETRVEELKREQDFLLFEKTVYGSDSRYLLVDTSRRRLLLKYKNRLLNSFAYHMSGVFPETVRSGYQVLTRKSEREKSRHALIFGTAFAIAWTRDAVSRQDPQLPVLLLTKKDFLSLFYAVEPGAMVYLLK